MLKQLALQRKKEKSFLSNFVHKLRTYEKLKNLEENIAEYIYDVRVGKLFSRIKKTNDKRHAPLFDWISVDLRHKKYHKVKRQATEKENISTIPVTKD